MAPESFSPTDALLTTRHPPLITDDFSRSVSGPHRPNASQIVDSSPIAMIARLTGR